ncbi:4-hydroxy-tetrahydrodipicolinate synthase [Amorphoplanes nipponensis]|uniref:4-hydroxy-tetrahydrodipicolinate synthase n=1 Tax=Actinoplanes nipponensis TaxID=135950 RepID=A0A919JDC5_9ACTN|nr:dihydrodipicolinate synthase family protein [Actinoplanes nipponensis]GIE48658.1 4-hydroxy-tetrahydrodipicolinate synthase [Actinoplanes nipponensis]
MTFSGVHVPLITPFDAAGEVALDALRALAGEVLDGGAAGLVALGTTGEPAALSPAEQQAVVDVVAQVCAERDAVLTVGANSVPAVRALRRWPGAGAALSLVPPFLRPGEDGVLAYFAALAAASPVPVLVYHVPYRTAQPLSAAAMRRLAAIPGVAGVKWAAGGIDAVTVELMADPPAGFAVLGGDDAYVAPLLALGAHGGILASAHLDTGRFAELVRAWHAGDLPRARELGRRLTALALAVFAEPNPTVVKAVLHAQGRIPTPAVRLPLVPAGADSLRAALEQL